MRQFLRPIHCLPLILLLASACAVNPNRTAQTIEQQGDAIYGEYVIAKEQGAALLADATVPDSTKRLLAQAMVDSKSAADSLQDALIEYSQVKAQLAAGTSSQDKLGIAQQNLEGWLTQAQPLIANLINALSALRGVK